MTFPLRLIRLSKTSQRNRRGLTLFSRTEPIYAVNPNICSVQLRNQTDVKSFEFSVQTKIFRTLIDDEPGLRISHDVVCELRFAYGR